MLKYFYFTYFLAEKLKIWQTHVVVNGVKFNIYFSGQKCILCTLSKNSTTVYIYINVQTFHIQILYCALLFSHKHFPRNIIIIWNNLSNLTELSPICAYFQFILHMHCIPQAYLDVEIIYIPEQQSEYQAIILV